MARPEKEAGTADLFDPFGHWKAWRDDGMGAWSKMMLDFVQSDAYARASAQWLDTYLAMSQPLKQTVDQAMTQTLGQFRLPSTDDILRLAERLTNLELRIDDVDARLDEIVRLLSGLAGATPAQRPPDRPYGEGGGPPHANGHAEPAPDIEARPAQAAAAAEAAPASQANGSAVAAARPPVESPVEPVAAPPEATEPAAVTEIPATVEPAVVETAATAEPVVTETAAATGTAATETAGATGAAATETAAATGTAPPIDTAADGSASPSETPHRSRSRRHPARPAASPETDPARQQEGT